MLKKIQNFSTMMRTYKIYKIHMEKLRFIYSKKTLKVLHFRVYIEITNIKNLQVIIFIKYFKNKIKTKSLTVRLP